MVGKLMIIDGNSLANRAFYAIPMLSNSQGFITNAIYGFYNMLVKVLEEEKPEYLVVAFDKGKVVFRHEVYAEYKGTRKGTPDELRPQFPVLKDLLRAMNIAVVELEGYEADDLIGTLVTRGEKEGFTNLVITGDRDAFQLISPQTKVYLTRKGISELEIYDEQQLKDKYGLKPKQMIDVKGLMGDASDNIPGIPGIGEKTAVKLVKEYGDLEEVLEHWADFKGKKLSELLRTYADQAVLSKKLATIVLDAPMEFDLENCRRKEPDYGCLVDLLKELEFRNILQSVLEKRAQKEKQEEQPEKVNAGETDLPTHLILTDLQGLTEYLGGMENGGQVAFYAETERKEPGQRVITACGLKVDGQRPALITWQDEQKLAEYLVLLKDFLIKKAGTIMIHDLKAVLLALFSGTGKKELSAERQFIRGIKGKKIKDTLLMAYLLNPARVEQDLGALAREKLDCATVPEKEAKIPLLAETLADLGNSLTEELSGQGMDELYREVELPLAFVLTQMERTGILLDDTILQEMGHDFETLIKCLTEEIYGLAGEEINLNSPKQLGILLFEKLGLAKGKKTKTGFSTSAEVLESLASEHEIVAKILDYRQLVKLKGTYIDGLIALRDPVSGRIHTTFNQAVTATGRLSSTEPNLQNIPIRLEEGRRIRRAFLSRERKVLLSADYSQIELRVLAHLAADDVLIEAFRCNQDIHARTAAEVFGVSMEAVTPRMRHAAKAVNFGIVYGISDFGLGRDLGISRAEAGEYIANYFARYRGVKAYLDRVVAEAREKGYVTTILNRRRYLPDLHSRNFHLRSFAERAAMNTPIQGSAADILKLAMVNLARALTVQSLDANILLQVHDELILEVPQEKTEQVGNLVNQMMSEAYPLRVPLRVDLQIGPNWYDLKPLKVGTEKKTDHEQITLF